MEEHGQKLNLGAMPTSWPSAQIMCQRSVSGVGLSCAYNGVTETKESPGFLAWLLVNRGLTQVQQIWGTIKEPGQACLHSSGKWAALRQNVEMWEVGKGVGTWPRACLTLSIPFTCLSHLFPPYSHSTAGLFAFWGEILPKLKTWLELHPSPSMRIPWDSRVNHSVLSELLSHFMDIYCLKWMASLMWLSPCLTEA